MRAIKSLPKTGWFNLMTATGSDYYTDVKLDTQPGGAIYTSGVIADAAYLAGGGTATDATLSKFDADGNATWQVVFGGALVDRADSLAVASDGSVYVTGITNNATVGTDAFVVKFDGAGALQWAKSLGSAGAVNDVGGKISLHPDGDIVVTFSTPASSVVVMKMAPADGAVVWKRNLASLTSYASSVMAASTGDIYVAVTAYVGASYYAVTAKYDASGALLWQKRLLQTLVGGAAFAMAEGVDGSIYMAHSANNYLGTLKFDSSGTVLWQTKTMASVSGTGLGIALDAAGNVYSSGTAGATQYVIKQDATGGMVWHRITGNGYYTFLACMPSGDLLIAGDGGATASSILTKYPASLPIGTFGGRAFSVPSAAYTLTTGTLVQSASTLVESASSAVVQNATWMVAAYKAIPTAKTVF